MFGDLNGRPFVRYRSPMSTAPGVGMEFAGYSIERLLGRGGGGLVYLARDLRLARHVALKILSTELADDPRFRERFMRESRLAASIDHPNIIPIYAADEVDGVLFIAMRYVAGTDLRRLLAEEHTLEIERALGITAQIADALDAAHAQGLVHRDVKPGNVLLTARLSPAAIDHAYLADFGITKHMTTDHSLTGAGQFVGTTDYVAPEQIMGGPLDGRADNYSLACVFYQCLTGAPPFEKDSDVAVIYAHLSDPRPSVTLHRADVPATLDDVVSKAMATSPDDRYPTASAFVAAVRRALQDRAAAASTAVSPAPAATQTVAMPAPVSTAEPPTATLASTPLAAAPPAAPAPAYTPAAAPPVVAGSPQARRITILVAVLVIAVLAAVLAVVVVLRGRPTSPTQPTSSAAPVAIAQKMLLTEGDFPAGAVSSLPTTLGIADIRCGAAPQGAQDEHRVAFQDHGASSGSGYFYYHAVLRFNSTADAAAYMDQLAAAAQSCTAQIRPPRTAPTLGDRTTRVVFPSGDDTITYDAIYIDKGKFVSVVMVSALSATPPPANEAEMYAGVALRHMSDQGA